MHDCHLFNMKRIGIYNIDQHIVYIHVLWRLHCVLSDKSFL